MSATPRRRPRRWRLWVLPLLLLAIGTTACTALTGGDGRTLEVDLFRAHNLFPGSPVKVLGVKVGRVADVVSPSDRDGAVATLRLDRDVELPADVTALVVQGSVLGERFVQLHPPYTGGPTLPAGSVIPMERSQVPAEFDELLASLDHFLAALPADEVDRFVRNAAGTLEGRGAELGRTLDAAADAVEALADNDEELVALTAGLADLTTALASRDAELRQLLGDYATLAGALAAERDAIDATLREVARLTVEVGDVLEEHGRRLGADVEVVARLGRTLDRNHTEIRRLLRGQADLFETAERVFDRERNWLPLVNQTGDLPRVIEERLAARLADLCARIGRDDCAMPDFWHETLPVGVCLDPLFPCTLPDEDDVAGLAEALERAVEEVPELDQAIVDNQRDARTDEEETDRRTGLVDRLTDGLRGIFGGQAGAGTSRGTER